MTDDASQLLAQLRLSVDSPMRPLQRRPAASFWQQAVAPHFLVDVNSSCSLLDSQALQHARENAQQLLQRETTPLFESPFVRPRPPVLPSLESEVPAFVPSLSLALVWDSSQSADAAVGLRCGCFTGTALR